MFAGISPYSSYDNCSNDVTCGKLDGKVVYGNVIETGLPEEADAPEEPKDKFVTDEDGKKYKLVEVDNESNKKI